MGRTDEFIFLWVILKVLGSELVFANELGLAKVVGILIESVVLEEIAQGMLFQVGIVLFTAIACVGHNIFR